MHRIASTRKIGARATSSSLIFAQLRRERNIYLFVIPAVVFFFVFRYLPIYFVQIAFREYTITQPISAAPWVGLKYFRQLFALPEFPHVLLNTVLISLYKLAFSWPLPILFAVLLGEMKSDPFRRVTQTIIYLPHFISWVVLGGIIMNFLALDGGLVNKLLAPILSKPQYWMGNRALFRPLLVITEIWKETGWACVIYLAAITRIDPELYEAAIVDGAGRVRRIFSITIPCIADVIVVLLIIRIGNLLNVGFEQNLVLVNSMVRNIGEILDVYVWRVGLQNGLFSLAAAAGLFKAVLAAILLNIADRVSKRMGYEGIF